MFALVPIETERTSFPIPDWLLSGAPPTDQSYTKFLEEIRVPSSTRFGRATMRTVAPGVGNAFPGYPGGVYVSADHIRSTSPAYSTSDLSNGRLSGGLAVTRMVVRDPMAPIVTVRDVSPFPDNICLPFIYQVNGA